MASLEMLPFYFKEQFTALRTVVNSAVLSVQKREFVRASYCLFVFFKVVHQPIAEKPSQ